MVGVDRLPDPHGGIVDVVGTEHCALEHFALDAEVPLNREGLLVLGSVQAARIQRIADVAAVDQVRVGLRVCLVRLLERRECDADWAIVRPRQFVVKDVPSGVFVTREPSGNVIPASDVQGFLEA